MDIILKKNEAEINENVAKGLLVVFGIVLLVDLLCWGDVFDIYLDMTIVLLLTALITLVVPAIMILKFHVYHNMMKYLVVTGTAFMAGAAYVLFTFQAVLIFVVPTVIARFYMHRRLLYYSGILSVITIIVAHMITGVYLRQPWIEPFTGMEAILRYGAVPRCLQYLGYFLLIFLMANRYMRIFLQLDPQKELLKAADNSNNKEMADKQEFEMLLRGLTEREQSVFVLLVRGYTNMQIANTLYLSIGTVKNYISTIYEKIETKERNALIMKYSRFVKESD